MHSNTRYTVVYKDSPTARNEYYGPFVSVSMAERFMDDLPDPLEGGLKTYKSFQPYDHNESTLAREVILRKRERGHILDEPIHKMAGVEPF